MDQISIPSILLVSIPEAIIVVLLGIISVGKTSYLKDRSNYKNIAFYTVISAITSFFIRRNFGSDTEILLLSILVISLLFIFIIRFKFYESIFATLFGMTIFLVTEVGCLLLVSSLSGIKLDSAYLSDGVRFLMSLPERIVQILLIVYAIRKDVKIIDLESAAIKQKEYYIQLIVYLLSIGTLIFLAIVMGKMIVFDRGDATNSSNTLLLKLNIYLTLFVTIVLTLAIRSTQEFYKNKSSLSNTELHNNLEYITELMNHKQYDDAKEAVTNLITHVEKN